MDYTKWYSAGSWVSTSGTSLVPKMIHLFGALLSLWDNYPHSTHAIETGLPEWRALLSGPREDHAAPAGKSALKTKQNSNQRIKAMMFSFPRNGTCHRASGTNMPPWAAFKRETRSEGCRRGLPPLGWGSLMERVRLFTRFGKEWLVLRRRIRQLKLLGYVQEAESATWNSCTPSHPAHAPAPQGTERQWITTQILN